MQTTRQTGTPAAPDSDDAGFHSGIAEAARREVDDLRKRVGEAGERLQDEGRKTGATMSHLIVDELDKRRESLGKEVKALEDAVRDASKRAEAPSPLMSQAVHAIESARTALETHSVDDIRHILTDYSRRNPALFVAGCVLSGLAIGRLMVASSEGSTATRSSATRSPATSQPATQTGMRQSSAATPDLHQTYATRGGVDGD
ncbi:hypothetical protein [Pseudotabrizicola sp. 4114]|uniref:hypothetical protein n=1 Tax=Pseudotabrizicola sp. 4114 TaxID=2817731 RepID=UPI002855578D|nr:seryl-tRNA synthetase [Pseudorhodobacter sp. 4114]